MCHKLLGCDAPLYEGDITSWHSQDCLLQRIMTQRAQLLPADDEHRLGVGVGSSQRGIDGVEENKGPIRC
jgi:hypothetical protein